MSAGRHFDSPSEPKRKRYSVEQIVAAVKQHEFGTPAAEIARKLGIAEQTFYRSKKQYGGLEVDEVRELKQLREENEKLKKLVADLSLDKVMLQDLAAKMYGPLPICNNRRRLRHERDSDNVSGLLTDLVSILALMELRSSASSKMVRSHGSFFCQAALRRDCPFAI